jgi:hypothetical protein
MLRDSTVLLSVTMPGTQSSHGNYEHFHHIDFHGKEVNGIKVLKTPSFCKCQKQVHLSNDFVKSALNEPPQELKERYRLSYWRGLTEEKRIALCVDRYVKALHPDNRGYKMQVV